MFQRFARLFILILLIQVSSVFAEPARMHLKIPVNPFAPWVIENENTISGIDIDIIELLAKDLGFTYELHPCPLARCLKMLQQGEGDFMLGLFNSDEREQYLRFIEPGYLRDAPKAFYLKVSDKREINAYADLSGLTIGLVRATRYFPKFDQDELLNKVAVSRDIQLLKMLDMGRLDTFIGTPSHIEILLAENAMEDKFRQAKYQHTEAAFSHLAISKKSTLIELEKDFSQALSRLIHHGKISDAVRRYTLNMVQIQKKQHQPFNVVPASPHSPESPKD